MLILGEETNLRFFSKSTSCSQGRFLRIKLYIWCFIHKFLYGDCFRFSIFILSEDFIFEVSKIKSEHWVNVHSEIFIKNHVIFVENLDFDNLFAQYMRTDRFKIKLKPQILDKNKKILKEKHVHVSMYMNHEISLVSFVKWTLFGFFTWNIIPRGDITSTSM